MENHGYGFKSMNTGGPGDLTPKAKRPNDCLDKLEEILDDLKNASQYLYGIKLNMFDIRRKLEAVDEPDRTYKDHDALEIVTASKAAFESVCMRFSNLQSDFQNGFFDFETDHKSEILAKREAWGKKELDPRTAVIEEIESDVKRGLALKTDRPVEPAGFIEAYGAARACEAKQWAKINTILNEGLGSELSVKEYQVAVAEAAFHRAEAELLEVKKEQYQTQIRIQK